MSNSDIALLVLHHINIAARSLPTGISKTDNPFYGFSNTYVALVELPGHLLIILKAKGLLSFFL